jgi:hypothetical protein
VTIVGANFLLGASVDFGGSAAASISVVSLTTITCQTPPHGAGAVTVTVSTVVGSGSKTNAYEYFSIPTVSGVSPAQGAAAGGTAVTVSGTNFYGGVSVDFGGSAATGASVINSTTIACTTSAHAAGSVLVSVTTQSGTGTKAAAYEYIDPPTVASVTPATGDTDGGANVTVSGTNFYSNSPATVDFGGSAATAVSVVNRTTITCTTSAHAAGQVTVTVTTPSGSGSKASAYEYIDPPTVTSVTPAQGATAGGTAVTVSGTNFYSNSPAGVDFGGSAATSVSVVDRTTITCTTAAHAEGSVTVSVTTPSGTGSQSDAYDYIAAPTVSSVTPTEGDSDGGTNVTVNGSRFYGAATVDFGGAAATNVSVVDTSTITCQTTAHAAGQVTVTVGTPSGSGSKTNAYEYIAAPTVTSVTPAIGPASGGTAVTVRGTNFYGGTSVDFGGSAATGVSVVNRTTIACATSAHAAGFVTATVTTPSGSGSKTTAYEYIGAPDVGGVTPPRGTTAGGTPVTVTGTNLYGATSVDFGGAAAAAVSVMNRSTLTCTTPAHVAGLVTVSITTASGTGSRADAYEYMDPPTVTGVTPAQGTTGGGTAVTVSGTNFYVGSPTVTFGGTAATSVSVVSKSSITCVTPLHAAGVVDVVVTTASGPGTGAGAYEYIAAPSVTSVTPAEGPIAGGAAVTVGGTNFYGTVSVDFGGSAATSVSVVDRSTLTCTTSAHAAGQVTVTVTTPSGSGSKASAYEYIGLPTVSSVSPPQGPIAGGTGVTVTGSGFYGGMTVRFGGTAATTVSPVSRTMLYCVTPAHAAGLVDVSVTTPSGTGTGTGLFRYVGAPQVTSVTPNKGTTSGGTAVTISGQDFAGAVTVLFDADPANDVSVVNNTTITCSTPAHPAAVVDVSVSGPGGTGTGTGAYEYVTSPIVDSVTPTTGGVNGGTAVTISGSIFTGTTTVTFGGTPATNISVVNDNTITCTTGAHGTVEWVDVTVYNPAPGTGTNLFQYVSIPEISHVTAVPSPALVNREVLFDCGASEPNGYYPLTYEWDFGDGETASGSAATHTYRRARIYTVTVTVTNTVNGAAKATLELIVRSTVGQFTSDANTDIPWWNNLNGNVWIWEMNGTAKVAEVAAGDEDHTQYACRGTGDFNRDGKCDFMLWRPLIGGLYARYMNYTTPGALLRLGSASASYWDPNGCTDLNGDGVADPLLVRIATLPGGAAVGTIYCWLMRPGGGAPTVVKLGTADYSKWELLGGPADLNNDGTPDLLFRYKSGANRTVMCWLMHYNGGLSVGIENLGAEAQAWSLVGAGDYTGDGKPDLLWRNNATGANKIWQMDGTTRVTDIPLDPKADPNFIIVGPR